MKSKAGFTLIEIMVSLVLVGLIASIAGTSVIMGMRGYLFAENDVITQKAQLALNRLNREFIELIRYQGRRYRLKALSHLRSSIADAGVWPKAGHREGGKHGSAVFNVPGTTLSGLTGDILVDRVFDKPDGNKGFSIEYNPGFNLWSYGKDIQDLYAVDSGRALPTRT